MEKDFKVEDITTINEEIFEMHSELNQEKAVPCAASHEE